MIDHLIDQIRAAGISAYPNEACGLIINVAGKSTFVECRNDSETPTDSFLMNQNDYMDAADRGEIIAIWHTHPEHPAEPSFDDEAGCNRSEVPWFILGIYMQDDGTFDCSELIQVLPDGRVLPYVDRAYVFGTNDCYTLVCDFYRREFQLELGEYPRVANFWEKGLDFFDRGFQEQGFVSLIDKEPEYGDLFIMQIGSTVSNHIAIYVGNGVILHHPHGRASRQDQYGGIWKKHTVHHIRHKTKC